MATTSFKAKARVIDMLGRQQIADTATAMGELMKNSLDAGAKNFYADFREDENRLILRDDGLGMREIDVTQKWLVLATGAKSSHNTEDFSEWLEFATQEQKVWCLDEQYGEKGVGRLSISTLGQGVVLWTIWGEGPKREGTLCIINWGFFESPELSFDDIPIVYHTFRQAPSKKEILKLINENYEITKCAISKIHDSNLQQRILETAKQICNFSYSEEDFPWVVGTTFHIVCLSNSVKDLFNENPPKEGYNKQTNEQIKAYYTFSNFWNPFMKTPNRMFCIHPSKDNTPLKRSDKNFWNPSDFHKCDHHISVDISDSGYVKGTIKNYEEAPILYERQLPILPDNAQSPGKLHVEIGYIQGQRTLSPLPDDIYRDMSARLEIAGGFSVYLNNVRIQPYGMTDNDFLSFEARRSLNAGRYYFSHRRMFGGVFIPSQKTTNLKEKAGREGFINNFAFRGLKIWLQLLFIDLADSYFGKLSNRKDKQERQNSKQTKPSKERLKQKKREYIRTLRTAIKAFPALKKDTIKHVQEARSILSRAADSPVGSMLGNCQNCIRLLQELHENILKSPLFPPVGVELTESESDQLISFQTEVNTFSISLGNEICALQLKLQDILGKSKNQEKMISILKHEQDELWRAITSDFSARIDEVKRHIVKLNRDLERFQSTNLDKCRSEYNCTLNGVTPEMIVTDENGEKRIIWEKARQKAIAFYHENIVPLTEQLNDDIQHAAKESSSAFVLSELTQQLQQTRLENSYLIDMAQLGLVFETSDHEFNSQIGTINNIINSLISDSNEHQRKQLLQLKQSIDIVDERISLYNPIIRRRRDERTSISGQDIYDFLHSRLECEKKGITVYTSREFLRMNWENIKWPIFLGAIYNIVTNSMYWVKRTNPPCSIMLSTRNNELIISDSGPGIPSYDTERIFLPGFSRKPSGRGLGLYIARESLKKIHYLLNVSEPTLDSLSGAVFSISPFDPNN